MKKLIYLMLLLLFFTSCKKLNVDKEKTFVEINVKKSADITPGYLNGGMFVTLMLDGKAEILPGGDVVSNGTYKIKGKKLTVQTGLTYEFDIISETEIQYNNRILRLQ